MTHEPLSAPTVVCPQCGDAFTTRGLPGHVRAVHDRRMGRAWRTDRRIVQPKPLKSPGDDA